MSLKFTKRLPTKLGLQGDSAGAPRRTSSRAASGAGARGRAGSAPSAAAGGRQRPGTAGSRPGTARAVAPPRAEPVSDSGDSEVRAMLDRESNKA